MIGCAKMNRGDLPGVYELYDDNGEMMLARYEECVVELKNDSTFLIYNCQDASLNAVYSWWYLEGDDDISVKQGDWETPWGIEKRSGSLLLFRRFDDGDNGVVYFKKKI
jgi:hypothetical protein